MRHKSRTGVLKRVSWSVLDQVASSLTNLMLTLAVANAVGASEFGAFSLAFSTYVLGQGAARAIAAEPLLILYSSLPGEEFKQKARKAAGAGLGIGILLGFGCLTFAAATHGSLREAFAAFGIVMPALLLQDIWRYVLIGKKQANRAFINDLVWGSTLLLLLTALLSSNITGTAPLILAWGGTAAIASVIGAIQAGVSPAPLALTAWYRDHSRLCLPYITEFMSATGALQITIYALAGVASLEAAGAIRAATVALAPVHLLNKGLRLVAIPEGRRLLVERPGQLLVVAQRVSVFLASLSLAWGIALLFLPDSIGERLLGDTWQFAQPVILPMAISYFFVGLVFGSLMGLRTLAAAKNSLQARTLVSALVLLLGIAGGAFGAAVGAAFGIAIANGVGAWLFWQQLRKAFKNHQQNGDLI